MSGLFAIYNRDESAVAPDLAAGMLEAMSDWQPDARNVSVEGPVALGHAMLWNTPESQRERLPAHAGCAAITSDARLDGREELAAALGIPISRLSDFGDSDLILAAYRRWGARCTEHLLGDFVFVIWDSGKRELFCARDHLGIRQLYFCARDGVFLASNDIRSLLSHPATSGRINEDAVADFLVNWGLEDEQSTFFSDINKLPPAHTLTVSAIGIRKACYWCAADSPPVHFSDGRDYPARLRELLELAVRDRLRSAYPVSSHLSGGLDSSAIAVIAARTLREHGQQLLAFNWLHEPSDADEASHHEWSNSRLIAARDGMRHRYVTLDESDMLDVLRKRNIAYGDSTLFWYEYPVREAASQGNSRTLLSGWGGDQFVSNHGQSYYADLLVHCRLYPLLQALWAASARHPGRRARHLFSTLYRRLLLVMAPSSLHRHLPGSGVERRSFPLVAASFMPKVQRALDRSMALATQPRRTVRSHMLASLETGHIQSRIESWATGARPYRLEYVYPLLDRRLVEFALGVPGDCFVKQGRTRYLFRSAVENLLPEDLLWANTKQEIHRVKRLVTLVGACYQQADRQCHWRPDTAAYIDLDRLSQAARCAGELGEDPQSACKLMDLESAFAVACSAELGAGGNERLSPE
jgi:asparagine synthase (glutamine-hydrolysing)